MAAYLERYLRGEYEQVWDELCALGSVVHDRESPLHEQAYAVARESMRRARHNVLLLWSRLRDIGFHFGYSWCSPGNQAYLETELAPPPQFAEAEPDILVRLNAFERDIGILPLSLRAWYEQVGAVNFVGIYPVEDPTDPEGFSHWQQVKSADVQAFRRSYSTLQAVRPCHHDLDPLWVYPFAYSSEAMDNRTPPELMLAPDEDFKMGLPGSGQYIVALHNAGADAIIENEWHETTFVKYLRICFRWGGFLGLACKSRKPEKELAFLTRDLLPI